MQELVNGVNMTLIQQNAFHLSEVTSTNSLTKGEKAWEASSWRSSSCRQRMVCHYAQRYPLLQDSTFQHQSSFQTGYFKPTSNSTPAESDSVLSLPECCDLKSDSRRRTSNPDANTLTPLSEPKFLGRPNTSYCWSTHRPNW